jgi:Ca2+-transporting ATPase
MIEGTAQQPAYRASAEAVLKQLGTVKTGLKPEQVTERLAQYGPNQLEELHSESWLAKYLRQFKDLMILLLLASAVISFYPLGDARTAVVLLALIAFNTTIGFVQEYKAERIMESLNRLIVPEAKVLRRIGLQSVGSPELVPGDIVYIEAGDSVPADLRLIDESELATNDFALTGESNPSRKFTHAISADVEIADRHNLVFMGTTVAIGHAHGVVIATGMRTELGRIANLSQSTEAESSPLQKEMNHIATRVTQGTVLLCIILLPIAIRANLGIKEAFLFAIGIASSIIPQGLPAEINTALAQAANKLAKARALVKKLSAVETLGATSVIATDKTGTLTKNEMTVESLIIGRNEYAVSGAGYETNGFILDTNNKPLNAATLIELELFFATGALASNAKVNPPDDEHAVWYTVGDPTEGALITLARKAGYEPEEWDRQHPELKEFAFDSARERMSSIRLWGDGKRLYVFAKGAPESILEQSTDIWDQGHTRQLSAHVKSSILARHDALAQRAMRNLAYAYKVLPAKTSLKKLTMEEAESGLTYMGMVSMMDPLREEVPEAMQAAHSAHIKISVVTGDFAATAQAIAAKAGLAKNKKDIPVVSGEELRHLSDTQVLQLVNHGSVIFSRVAPEDKLRIVELVKSSGQIIAVTGDGINDAPALKRADIGVAMGKTGTDVAKQSADIVLLDDSFHTLVGAIEQGRIIFQNIKKATLCVFSANFAELTVNLAGLGVAVLFGIPLALTVMQILAIDLIAELFPVAALGWDGPDSNVMDEPPRNPKDHILTISTIGDLLWCGLLIGGFAFINYLFFFHRNHIDPHGLASGSMIHMKATALTYLTIVLCQLGNIMQRRSKYGLFTMYQFTNKVLWLAMALSLTCVLAIIYTPINQYFGAGPLSLIDWLYALMAAALFLGIREFQRYQSQHTRKAVLNLHLEHAKN